MSYWKPDLYKDIMNEFEEKGFMRSSEKLRRYITETGDINIKKFAPIGKSKRMHSFSSLDIFGDKHIYYYDINHKEDFVKFLVTKFLTKNKEPCIGMRAAFTHILHIHGLHWQGCMEICFRAKPKNHMIIKYISNQKKS